MIETTKYAGVTKKNIPITNKENYHMCKTETTIKPEVIVQLVNEMKAIIRAVTKNKPPAKKTQTSKLQQTKKNKQKTRRTQRPPLLK